MAATRSGKRRRAAEYAGGPATGARVVAPASVPLDGPAAPDADADDPLRQHSKFVRTVASLSNVTMYLVVGNACFVAIAALGAANFMLFRAYLWPIVWGACVPGRGVLAPPNDLPLPCSPRVQCCAVVSQEPCCKCALWTAAAVRSCSARPRWYVDGMDVSV